MHYSRHYKKSNEEENKLLAVLQEIPSLEIHVKRQPYCLRVMISQSWMKGQHCLPPGDGD